MSRTTERQCQVCGRNWETESDLRAAASGAASCDACTQAAADVDVLSRAMRTERALELGTAPRGWSRDDGQVFLAHFCRHRDALEPAWRWLTLRLWPISAGLLIGAVLSLWNAESTEIPDLEGASLGLERSADLLAEDDLVAEVLSLEANDTPLDSETRRSDR